MTTSPTDIERLAKLVRQQANKALQIKEGITNGVPVLHVSDKAGNSYTIRNSGDWAQVPNVLNAENKHIEQEIV